jgi:hypothetical protein
LTDQEQEEEMQMNQDKAREAATQESGNVARARRRGFLMGAGAAAGVAGAAALVAGRSPQAEPEVAAATSAQQAAGSRGYHVTEHVRKYYDTAKV